MAPYQTPIGPNPMFDSSKAAAWDFSIWGNNQTSTNSNSASGNSFSPLIDQSSIWSNNSSTIDSVDNGFAATNNNNSVGSFSPVYGQSYGLPPRQTSAGTTNAASSAGTLVDLAPRQPFPPEVIDGRYTDVHVLNFGRYGLVASAKELQAPRGHLRRKVAIKKVAPLGDQRLTLMVLREVRILARLQHSNIVELYDTLFDSVFNLYLVTPLMDGDLNKLLMHARAEGYFIDNNLVRRIIHQTLCALKYVHSAKVIHRDVKPANLLVNHHYGNYHVKLCDFGSARVDALDASDEKRREVSAQYTKVIGTVCYNAPELVLPSVWTYTRAVDIWAVGCILAEMLNNKPLFQVAGYPSQYDAIVGVLGTPTHEELLGILSRTVVTPEVQKCIALILPRERMTWRRYYPHADPDALVLLNQMLQYNPALRPRAEQLLSSSDFLSMYANAKYEPTCALPFQASDMQVDGLQWNELSEELAKEVHGFHEKVVQSTKPVENLGARMPPQKQFFSGRSATCNENFDGNFNSNNIMRRDAYFGRDF